MTKTNKKSKLNAPLPVSQRVRFWGCVIMDSQPTLDDVYLKFGETSEAAQLLETQLGNMLFLEQSVAENLIGGDGIRAAELMTVINRQTLGTLMKNAKINQSVDEIAGLLDAALKERNRLSHSFYRQHNFRRNSGEGRAIMMCDLDAIHDTILDACKKLMLLDGTDLDELVKSPFPMPTKYLPL